MADLNGVSLARGRAFTSSNMKGPFEPILRKPKNEESVAGNQPLPLLKPTGDFSPSETGPSSLSYGSNNGTSAVAPRPSSSFNTLSTTSSPHLAGEVSTQTVGYKNAFGTTQRLKIKSGRNSFASGVGTGAGANPSGAVFGSGQRLPSNKTSSHDKASLPAPSAPPLMPLPASPSVKGVPLILKTNAANNHDRYPDLNSPSYLSPTTATDWQNPSYSSRSGTGSESSQLSSSVLNRGRPRTPDPSGTVKAPVNVIVLGRSSTPRKSFSPLNSSGSSIKSRTSTTKIPLNTTMNSIVTDTVPERTTISTEKSEVEACFASDQSVMASPPTASMLNRPRPGTPDAQTFIDSSVPLSTDVRSAAPVNISILNRPRPSTPNAQSFFDSTRRPSLPIETVQGVPSASTSESAISPATEDDATLEHGKREALPGATVLCQSRIPIPKTTTAPSGVSISTSNTVNPAVDPVDFPTLSQPSTTSLLKSRHIPTKSNASSMVSNSHPPPARSSESHMTSGTGRKKSFSFSRSLESSRTSYESIRNAARRTRLPSSPSTASIATAFSTHSFQQPLSTTIAVPPAPLPVLDLDFGGGSDSMFDLSNIFGGDLGTTNGGESEGSATIKSEGVVSPPAAFSPSRKSENNNKMGPKELTMMKPSHASEQARQESHPPIAKTPEVALLNHEERHLQIEEPTTHIDDLIPVDIQGGPPDLTTATPSSTPLAVSQSIQQAQTPDLPSPISPVQALGPEKKATFAKSSRKEPPKVDIRLELELEMDAAITNTHNIIDSPQNMQCSSVSLPLSSSSPVLKGVETFSSGYPRENFIRRPSRPSPIDTTFRQYSNDSSSFSKKDIDQDAGFVPPTARNEADHDRTSASAVETSPMKSKLVGALKGGKAMFIRRRSTSSGDLLALGPSNSSSNSLSLDKSLPPTPVSATAPGATRSLSPAPIDGGPTLRRASSDSKATPVSSPNSFQLVSATTTKGAKASDSVAQVMANEDINKAPFSNGFGPKTNSFLPPSAAPFGRRWVDKFGLRGVAVPMPPMSNDKTSLEVEKQLYGTPSPKNTSSEVDKTRKRRSSSFSKLSKSEKSASFGMGLIAARKSADMLTSATMESSDESEKPLAVSQSRHSYATSKSSQLSTFEPSYSPMNNARSPTTTIEQPEPVNDILVESPVELPVIHSPISSERHGDETSAEDNSHSTQIANDNPGDTPFVLPFLFKRRNLPAQERVMSNYSTRTADSIDTNNGPFVSASATPVPPALTWNKTYFSSEPVTDINAMSSEWLEVEELLPIYTAAVAQNAPDRTHTITNVILPFLRREADESTVCEGDLARRQRNVLFGWLATLTSELRNMQPVHRGSCLEAVAAIAESHFMSSQALRNNVKCQERYRTAFFNILDFAVEKLNDKAVYANTLVFSGRVFALAFFRIEGVAYRLLRALPVVKRQYLRRILDEAGVDDNALSPVNKAAFPSHLLPLCLNDLQTYTELLLPLVPRALPEEDNYLVRDREIAVEMSGNWLIRWTASDSDLPFAFYRAYHRQLAAHLVPLEYRGDIGSHPSMAPAQVITAPGFLFLAASLLEKSDALVHRNLRSVTSIASNNGANFNTNDSANLSFGQKPKVLELANRRLVSTMLDIVGGPPISADDDGDVAPDIEVRRHAFAAMLQVWIRACVKRTSMWDTRSVFILLDLIEGLIYTLSYPVPTAKSSQAEIVVPQPQESSIEMFDIPFIFSFVKIILLRADNTVALMRTIAFLYAHFEIFTLRTADRETLCAEIILDQEVFSRLYLHWNAGVRGYFIRLLVWRLARLGITSGDHPSDGKSNPQIISLFGLMNARLESIRQRHDELEPLDDMEDDFFNPKRSTICSTRGVKEAPYAVDELMNIPVHELSDDGYESEEEPQELVQTITIPQKLKGISGNTATVSRVVSWLKGGLVKAKQNNKNRSATSVGTKTNTQNTTPVISSEDSINSGYSPSNTSDSTSVSSTVAIQNDQPGEEGRTGEDGRVEATAVTTISPNRKGRQALSPRSSETAFFEFGFDSGLNTPPPVVQFKNRTSSASSILSHASGDTLFPAFGNGKRKSSGDRRANRVSARFSKRASILPPTALDMLKNIGEAVPPIPAQYRVARPAVYDKKLHPYAVRGLRDYEDALDEWTDWVARLQQEEDEGKKHTSGFVDTVPRLAVAWPASFEEGP